MRRVPTAVAFLYVFSLFFTLQYATSISSADETAASRTKISMPTLGREASNSRTKISMPTLGREASNSRTKISMPTLGREASNSRTKISMPTLGNEASDNRTRISMPTLGNEASDNRTRISMPTLGFETGDVIGLNNGSPTSVPTLSEWGMIITAVAFALIGVLFEIRKRKTIKVSS